MAILILSKNKRPESNNDYTKKTTLEIRISDKEQLLWSTYYRFSLY